MNCIVCVASVPDTASVIKIGPDGKGIDETGIKWIVSPTDEYALEEAIKLTEDKGGEVTVVTYGPASAEAALRDCLARGAHQAVHVLGGEKTLGDSFTIAKVLAGVIKDREFDLVLCGIKGVGTDCSQVGQMLAELLDIPHVAGIIELEVGDGSLAAGRDVEGGREKIECPMPALLTCQKGLNEPRLPSLPNIMKAGMKPQETVTCADLGIEVPANLVEIKLYSPPPARGACKLVEAEEPAAAARELARLLNEEAKVI